MSGRKENLTVDVMRAWLQATEQQRAQEEARTRSMIIDRVLNDVMTRVQWGRTPQGAADEVWRIRGRGAPRDVKQIVAEALEGLDIGWVRRDRGGEQ
jgi:hypothetical protein